MNIFFPMKSGCVLLLLLVLSAQRLHCDVLTNGKMNGEKARNPMVGGGRRYLLLRREDTPHSNRLAVEAGHDEANATSEDTRHTLVRQKMKVVRQKHRAVTRSYLHGFGRFNSDTHGCRGILSRNCTSPASCGGCLGLYTCDLSKGTCALKGLSRATDGFLESLRDT